ncbi:hypothetical protein QE152_g33066 [Popillia japonica]|uniref:Uncharacterized protein n=1 Tax=Popillia japonica TaxID=7064 RepID=A0AAW1IY67_POPJA
MPSTLILKLDLATCNAQKSSSHKECRDIIGEAYKNNVINGPRGEKTIPNWWSDEINDKRKQCMEASRGYTTMAKTNAREVEKLRASIKYKLTKKELRKLIRLSKREDWSKLCNDLNSDVCGDGYKIAVKSLKNFVRYDIPDKDKKEIAKKLFPCSSRVRQDYRMRVDTVLPFTAIELKEAFDESLMMRKNPFLEEFVNYIISKLMQSNSILPGLEDYIYVEETLHNASINT